MIAGGSDSMLREVDFFSFCSLYAMTVRDCAPAEAGVDHLTPAHHAVLAGGKTGDMGIGSERVELFIHHINKSPRGTDFAPQYTGGSSCSCLT